MEFKAESKNLFMTDLKNKKILITGASGVIGYNLVKKFKSIGNCEIHVNYLHEIEI